MLLLFLKALKILFILAIIFFVVTFTVYFFNLDMKLTAAIYPWLLRHYDKVKRDQHLIAPEKEMPMQEQAESEEASKRGVLEPGTSRGWALNEVFPILVRIPRPRK